MEGEAVIFWAAGFPAWLLAPDERNLVPVHVRTRLDELGETHTPEDPSVNARIALS